MSIFLSLIRQQYRIVAIPQQPTFADAIVDAEVEAIALTDEIAIRSERTDAPNDSVQTTVDAIVPFRRSLKRLGIRELRLVARDRGLKRYSQFTKPQLLEYLQA